MSLFHRNPETRTGESTSFQPEDCLTGILLRSRAPFSVTHALHGVLYVDPVQRRFQGSRNILLPLCSCPASELSIRPLRDWPDAGQNLPLEELLWASAWYACDGRLPPAHSRHDVIALRHWPNLTRLPATPDVARLCALLSRKGHSLHLARKLLGIDEPLACRFYSAAWYAGLLELLSHQHDLADEPASVTTSLQQGFSQALQQLWQRLARA